MASKEFKDKEAPATATALYECVSSKKRNILKSIFFWGGGSANYLRIFTFLVVSAVLETKPAKNEGD
jgi:hypothetical protein